MRVCYFGTYDNKLRNRILIEGLRENGVDVFECHVDVWSEIKDKSQIKGILLKIRLLFKLLYSYIELIFKYLFSNKGEVIIVGYPGYIDMFLAKPLSLISNRPLVFDSYMSLYETLVKDRRLIKEPTIWARLCYLIDRWTCNFADKVLLDTEAHIAYYSKLFNLSPSKFARVFIGSRETHFHKEDKAKGKEDKFKVIYYGQYVPLHGVSYIVKAAKLLEDKEDIEFILVGNGQDYQKARKLAEELRVSNIKWIYWLEHDELLEYIKDSHVCLGIFGESDKANNVIPNKLYEAMSLRKAIITQDSPASRELLANKENAVLCKGANAEALVSAIMLLKRDRNLRMKIANNGYETFKKRATPKKVGRQLKKAIMDLV